MLSQEHGVERELDHVKATQRNRALSGEATISGRLVRLFAFPCLCIMPFLPGIDSLIFAGQPLQNLHAGSAERSAMHHNEKGLQLLKEGDLLRAITEFDEAIKRDPKFAEAYNNLGVAQRQKG
jgi:tetratricopeptide (TPR) repeat protein